MDSSQKLLFTRGVGLFLTAHTETQETDKRSRDTSQR